MMVDSLKKKVLNYLIVVRFYEDGIFIYLEREDLSAYLDLSISDASKLLCEIKERLVKRNGKIRVKKEITVFLRGSGNEFGKYYIRIRISEKPYISLNFPGFNDITFVSFDIPIEVLYTIGELLEKVFR